MLGRWVGAVQLGEEDHSEKTPQAMRSSFLNSTFKYFPLGSHFF